jgi:hypothetical protein
MEFFLYIPALFEIRSLLLILIIGENQENVWLCGSRFVQATDHGRKAYQASQ